MRKRVVRLSRSGERTAIYDSARDAAESVGIQEQSISRACRKGVRAAGWFWRYAEPKDLENERVEDGKEKKET